MVGAVKRAAERTPAEWTSARLESMLRASRPAPKWAVLTGVSDATAWARSRSADALVMGLWPSLGIHLHGFEIKVARSDWLREIQTPEKAEAFARYCHFWWILAAPSIVKLEELPATWGLMEPSGEGLKVRRPSTMRADRVPPDEPFLAALLRRVCEQAPTTAALHAEYSRGVKAGEISERQLSQIRKSHGRDPAEDLEKLKACVATFEKAAGVSVGPYDDNEREGKLLRLVRESTTLENEIRSALKQTRRRMLEAAAHARRMLNERPKAQAGE